MKNLTENPRRFKRKEVLARTRLAGLLSKLSRRSKTGAVPLKTKRLAKRLKVCDKTIHRATAMIRGRDLRWLQTHGFVLMAYFDRSIGAKGARRLLAVRASTAARGRIFAQEPITAFGLRKPRHFRSTWGRSCPTGKGTSTARAGVVILEIYADACSSYLQNTGSNGQLSASLKRDMSLTNRVGAGTVPVAYRPALRAGDSKKKSAFGGKKPTPLAWFIAGICIDVANERKISVSPGALAVAVQGWIRDGWWRDDIFSSFTEATDILKRSKTTLRNPGGFLVSMFDRRMLKLCERRPGSRAQRYQASKLAYQVKNV